MVEETNILQFNQHNEYYLYFSHNIYLYMCVRAHLEGIKPEFLNFSLYKSDSNRKKLEFGTFENG